MFYLVPTLSRELFLDINFMKVSKLVANIDSLTTNIVGMCVEANNSADDVTSLPRLAGCTKAYVCRAR